MENKVYYGEYSLKHWIDLILRGNVTLPEYQRYFVWSENKVRTLINTFKKQQFVPPITIGAFKEKGDTTNLILDGQQRLTSVLLAYLGLFPDKDVYKKAVAEYVNENDDEEDDKIQFDNVIEWTFNSLVEKGKSKEEILPNLTKDNYKIIDWGIEQSFFDKTFLGFSYLVPDTTDEKDQQGYYSSVFRHINNQGETLSEQESRRALYYLNKDLVQYFDPEFMKGIKNGDTRMDTVRYLSLLSQYHKDKSTDKVARGYKPKMESYYEKYIYSVSEPNTMSTPLFYDFATLFPGGNYFRN